MQKQIKTIGVVSPSLMLSKRELRQDKWLPYLQSLGLKVIIAPSVARGTMRYENWAQDKAKDIMQMYLNPQVDALVAVHGGAGALNVNPYLDYEVIRQNPKPMFGFSDTTSMQMAIYAQTKTPFVSGFSPEFDWRGDVISPLVDDELRKVLRGEKIIVASGETVNDGVTEGILLGECLSPISDLNGTAYYPDLTDAILLIEDECEKAYKIGLMLTQLRLNPQFKKVKAVIFGRFSECEDHPTQGTMDEVIADFCKEVEVPIIKNFNFGHFKDRYVLPMGVKYRLDAQNCILTQLEDL